MIRNLFFFVVICSQGPLMAQKIDIQGHRGARGLLPENTIPAMILALDLGVTTVEMDLAITKDGQVIVSHEPWFASEICLDPSGNKIPKEQEKTHNIYEMTYEEVMAYDCGSVRHPNFPRQKSIQASKPLLSEVIRNVERHVKGETLIEVDYNIEIKSTPDGDGVFHPKPEEFSDLVYAVIDAFLPWERVVIQSFDFRVLQYWKKKYPQVRLAVLIANDQSIDQNLKTLGFTPEIYSPYFELLTREKVTELKKKKIRVIPWTVNEIDKMKTLAQWGVDGIITDYPDRAVQAGLTPKSRVRKSFVP